MTVTTPQPSLAEATVTELAAETAQPSATATGVTGPASELAKGGGAKKKDKKGSQEMSAEQETSGNVDVQRQSPKKKKNKKDKKDKK